MTALALPPVAIVFKRADGVYEVRPAQLFAPDELIDEQADALGDEDEPDFSEPVDDGIEDTPAYHPHQPPAEPPLMLSVDQRIAAHKAALAARGERTGRDPPECP